MNPVRYRVLIGIASLMIVFGVAEVVTGFTRNFFGVHTSNDPFSLYMGAVIGGLYIASGLLVLTMKRRAARLAVLLLIIDVAGRIEMASTGLYPTGSIKQIVALAAGTAVVAAFAFYIAARISDFD